MSQNDHIWTDSDGTKVAELSTLEGNGLARNGVIDLPGFAGEFNLRNATPDVHNEEIAGWKFEKNGQKYLVIND